MHVKCDCFCGDCFWAFYKLPNIVVCIVVVVLLWFPWGGAGGEKSSKISPEAWLLLLLLLSPPRRFNKSQHKCASLILCACVFASSNTKDSSLSHALSSHYFILVQLVFSLSSPILVKATHYNSLWRMIKRAKVEQNKLLTNGAAPLVHPKSRAAGSPAKKQRFVSTQCLFTTQRLPKEQEKQLKLVLPRVTKIGALLR